MSSPLQRVRRQSLVADGSSSSSTQQPPAATDLDQPAILPSLVMDQLVSRVTEEVTKRLQPLLSNLGSLAQPAQSPPSTSSQAPAVSLPVEQSTFLQSSGPNIQQAQGHAIQDTVEAPAVHNGVQSVLASLSVADFQTTGTSLHAQSSHGHTSSSAAAELASVASFLLRASLQPSSIPSYQRAWKLFHYFFCIYLSSSFSSIAYFTFYFGLIYCLFVPFTVCSIHCNDICVMFGLLP